MRVVVITPPEKLVTLAEVKEHLRLDDDDHDATLALHISTACRAVDGPTGNLGKSFGVQTLELQLHDFPRGACANIDLPFGPLINVLSVTYLDDDGVDQVLIEDVGFAVIAAQGVGPVWAGSWPSARCYPASVRIRYRAGHVVDASADPLVAATPDNIRSAALLHVEILYDRPDGSALDALERSRADLLALDRSWAV